MFPVILGALNLSEITPSWWARLEIGRTIPLATVLEML